MNQEKVSEFIKKLREENNLTQKDLADKYNVTYQAVSKWENKKAIPDIVILKSMSEDFNISIDNILNGEYEKNNSSNKKKNIIILFALILIISLLIILKFSSKERDFEFKTLSTRCDNFTISGNISYNSKKSSIYITNINYCGGNDTTKYEEIECILYEIDGNKEIKINSYKSNNEKTITLEEFLRNVNFVIDNYNRVCKKYTKDSFKLTIKAKVEGKTINYDIPLSLDEKC